MMLAVGSTVGMPASTGRADDTADDSTTALITADPAVAGVIADFAPDGCTDPDLPITHEEARLTATLPDADDPTVPANRTFARTMVEGGGFDGYTRSFAHQLCRSGNLDAATRVATHLGQSLWKAAVRRAQSPGTVRGDLPRSDDRPLYWTRIESMAVLHQWAPSFDLSAEERAALVDTFDRAARGMDDIQFPVGKDVKRVIVSGFDPYTLDGGTSGEAPDTVGNNIRHGNPSGAVALALDGTRHRGPDGTTIVIEAYTLPVSYPEFARGYLEDTVGPFLEPGEQQVDASITVSQAGGAQFNLEEWNARYHGVSPGNDTYAPCPTVDGKPQLAVDNPGCNTQVVDRWGGGDSLTDPPQWTRASLPIEEMIAARTGTDVPRPPGDTWPDESVAFGVVWNTNYSYFADCTSPEVTEVDQRELTYPPSTSPTPPPDDSCSRNGAGGDYLSNESAYRNTLLRDRLGVDIPAGHIHTPDMQHFETDFAVSDPTFDAWRNAIVAQTVELVHVVGGTA